MECAAGHADGVEPIPPERASSKNSSVSNWPDNTIVVITADHGEAFQEHGVLGHTVHLYDEVQHVSLLVRWPLRIPAGRALP